MAMLSFRKARHMFQRWFLRKEEDLSMATDGSLSNDLLLSSDQAALPDLEDTPDQKISSFIEELNASSQEWFGRVRMINLDSIRERMGTAWTKLETKVGILAEKVIQNEVAGGDRYLKIGNSEFIVFFSDATPEESRIRCMAIVETIHEKLFGFEAVGNNANQRMVECHVIHRDDLEFDWDVAASSNSNQTRNRSTMALHKSFRRDAEILDGADIVASAQIVIDSIISHGAESQDMAELTPLLIRLQHFSRSLKALEPALAATDGPLDEHTQRPSGSLAEAKPNNEAREACGENGSLLLDTTWEDIAELVSALDVGSGRSHADLLDALGRLRRARLERAARAFAGGENLTARQDLNVRQPFSFEYTPVYRSVSRGERIHHGIYRVGCQVGNETLKIGSDDLTGYPRQDMMISERANLEHAIQYLSDRRTEAGFALMVSVHVETLRGPNSKMQYSLILRKAQLRAKRLLLIEITGYSDGDDTIGVRRAIEELRVHSRAVWLSLSRKSINNLEKIAADCKRLGIHALGIDVSQFNRGDAETIDTVARLASAGSQYSVLTLVNGVHSAAVLAKAIALDISYICAPALRPPLPAPDNAQCARLEDLYSFV
jgi:EAL domain-containing protein (putative c-di-GMP-specific phosphodiesterase class I)